ncbi:MAG: monovalent cation/H(+) antiporter subunit G [Micrococcaceae bacterium]
MIFDILSSIFFIMGALFTLAGSVAVVVFPDVLSRMHGATKPQVLGLFCFTVGFVFHDRSLEDTLFLALVWTMQLLTIPVSAHMVGRTAHRADDFDENKMIFDELKPLYEKGPTETKENTL